MPSLTRAEAQHRARLLSVDQVTVALDLDRGPEHFHSRSTLRLTAHSAGETFLDFRPVTCERVELDGIPLPEPVAGRIPITLTPGEHTLLAEGLMGYSRDGQGLHRSVDPADGEAYVYGHLFLDQAPRVFACIDQPDLKAPYAVSVRTPQAWSVVGNGAASRTAPGHWQLAQTPPLATYFVTVCAGPWASALGEHDGIPLGIHARRSLAAALATQAPQLLDLTARAFDHFHERFGIRYPFGEYHQVFVPEFNAGAMENPGCVTIRDQYLYRGAATEEEIATRSNTIVHEMAHMWFGDLVTMAWWDDLWLNESFAEYMAVDTMARLEQGPSAWVAFGIQRKLWGYAAERSPSTHPVAGSPAPDALSALGNFDGISYAKGASVLRQLIAHIGEEAFNSGVTAYLSQFAYANGELADFLAAMEKASGQQLDTWAQAWLRTAGADTLSWSEGMLRRTVPSEHPADRVHALDVAAFADGLEIGRQSIALTRDVQPVDLGVLPPGRLVIPNAADLTWGYLDFDDETLAGMVDSLAGVPDEVARQVAWTGMLGAVHRGTVDPRMMLELTLAALPSERDPAVIGRVGDLVRSRVISWFLPAGEQRSARRRLGVAAQHLVDAGVGLPALRLVVACSEDVTTLQAWARGEGGLPPELQDDWDFRWLVIEQLAAAGAMDADEIARHEQADGSLTGHLAALTARAAIPEPAAKEAAWGAMTADPAASNYEVVAISLGLWTPARPALTQDLIERFPEAIVGMQAWMGDDALGRLVLTAYPCLVGERTAAMTEQMLSRTDLTPGVRRALIDIGHRHEEAMRSLHRYAATQR